MEEERTTVQARYRREVDGNYLILSDQDFREKEYTLQMLVNNHPEHFLRLRLSNLNGQPVLMYEVTSLQPVSRIFERSGVGEKQLRLMLDGLENVLKEARRYLLPPSDILLDPEYIFFDQDRKMVRFLYAPEYGCKGEGSLKGLAEFLLRHLDHKDAAAVSLGYSFYDRCSDETANLSRILEELGGEPESEPERERAAETAGRAVPFFGADRRSPGCRTERKHADESDYYVKENVREAEKETSGTSYKEAYIEDIKNAEDRDAMFSPRGCTDRGKPEKGKKKRVLGLKKADLRGLSLILGTSLGCSVLFALIVWFGRLDLTQTGGLFFGMIALVWLIYRMTIGNKKEKEDIWADELEDPDEEEAFLEALMSDVYSKEPGRQIPVGADLCLDQLRQRRIHQNLLSQILRTAEGCHSLRFRQTILHGVGQKLLIVFRPALQLRLRQDTEPAAQFAEKSLLIHRVFPPV